MSSRHYEKSVLIRSEIVVRLINNGPMKLADLAKCFHTTPQRVQYHLMILIRDGVLLVRPQDGCNHYAVQDVFLEDIEEVMDKLKPLLQWVAPKLQYGQATTKEAIVLANNVSILMNILSEYIATLFEGNGNGEG